MNDFDNELTAAVVGDGIDRSAPTPEPGEAIRAGKRRRTRRFAALGTATVVVGLAGVGVIGFLATGDTNDVIVSDPSPPASTLGEPESIPTSSVPIKALEPSTTLDLAAPPDTDVSVGTLQPSPTSAPTAPPPPTVVSPASTVEINEELTRGVATVDVDNQMEIRDSAGNTLWTHRYCEQNDECRAVVQTVTTDDAWLIVDRGDFFGDSSTGEIESSELQRISLADGTMSIEAAAAPGSRFVAGQPTVAGLLLATHVDRAEGFGVAVTATAGDVERVLGNEVTSVEVSADGRYLATAASNPRTGGGRTNIVVQDLMTGRSATSTVAFVMARATAWSPDGTMLLVADAWEETQAVLIDPWAGREATDEDFAQQFGHEFHWESACFVDDSTVAVATWNSPYSEEPALPGTIVLLDTATMSVVGDLAVEAFGYGLVCHLDGTASFVSMPLVTETFGTEEFGPYDVVRPDYEAPTAILHAAGDGQLLVTAGDGARLDAVR